MPKIIDVISACVLFYENKEIDKNPEIQNLSCFQYNNFGIFDKDKKYVVKFLSDEEFNKLFACEDSDISDEESDKEEEEQLLLDSIKENQTGGFLGDIDNYKWKYFYCLKKLLEIEYDLL